MSFLLRTSRQAPRAFVQVQRATFVSTPRAMVGKEDNLHQDVEHRKSNVEQSKHEQKGGSEWKETLASNSESIVKAERDETKSTEEHLKKLQDETTAQANKQ